MSGEERTATFSPDGLHRYTLTRQWGAGPVCVFVMLNPSTADGSEDDPTIRRCRGFAQALGAGSLHVVNLYSYRATNPDDLYDARGAGIRLNGEAADDAIIDAARLAAISGTLGGPVVPAIAAWGAGPAPLNRLALHRDRIAYVADVFLRFAGGMAALGTTKAGQPRHPLYLPGAARPSRWPLAEATQ